MTLYILDDLSRFFLVPDGVEPPYGDLGVRTVLGKRRFFDAEKLAQYEVPREQAHAHAKAAVDRFFDSARHSFTTAGGGVAEKPPSDAVKRDVEAFMKELRALMGGLRKALADKPSPH